MNTLPHQHVHVVSPPVIRRAWAMPRKDTFALAPVAELLDRWLEGRAVVVDPFARDSTRGTITNDLSPKTKAQHHMLADVFAVWLQGQGVVADAVLIDPPYSPRQIVECYQSAGLATSREATQHAGLMARVRDGLAAALRPGGISISFGWNTVGMGKGRGFDLVEILLVSHGGSHNDTIVTVERKLSASRPRSPGLAGGKR